ncbi:hypothetical protein PMI07_006190 [Rhizobium sp. CF080]|nr:hypothetical protein PMI07_006190 [Rhizobium sp. CF080]
MGALGTGKPSARSGGWSGLVNRFPSVQFVIIYSKYTYYMSAVNFIF